jgi:3-hydroxyacyl-CoA dehydrogenase/enoyl-CoA hydratase/3-hydroxybutyryl-CoA epimerase
MGADIAGVCVVSGMEVTLQDISPEQLERGIKSQGRLFARKFKTKAAKDAAKARLIADPDGKGIGRADVVIEAIVERLDIKQKLFSDVESKIKPGAVLATNTSSLKLADNSAPMRDPGRLIGLHFVSPVAQMPLVEVVRGATTRDEEVKRGAAFVTAIGKFPLITKDVPGFLVNKVLTPYMFAAMQRLEQGEDKEKIDEAVRAFGMPMGPIELADNVGLDICAHVAGILGQSSQGSKLERLVASGRLGKKTGEGFYVWKDGKPVKSGAEFSKASLEQLGRELVAPMIAEAQRVLDEGVVETADLVDAGMIFGTGFAPFRGGPLHYRSTHANAASTQRDAAE